MKKYLILMLCLLSLRGTAQNRYEDLGNLLWETTVMMA